MGRIIGISMAGIDAKTDLGELQRLQRMDEKVEFGVIVSKTWYENGNRYWDPDRLSVLKGKGLNLCAHACGRIARAALEDDWQPLLELLGDNAGLFKRVQLNIAGYSTNPKELAISVPEPFEEVVIQQRAAYNCPLFYNWFLKNEDDRSLSVLIDGSGGLGHETALIPLYAVPKVGYAGGIGPDNAFDKTVGLLGNPVVHDFWIDMESGVRTDDWFDIKKAEKVIREANRAVFAVPGAKRRLAEDLWQSLGDVPINDDDEIVEPWKQFPAGTDRFEIWHWFEDTFGLSVARDLMHIGDLMDMEK